MPKIDWSAQVSRAPDPGFKNDDDQQSIQLRQREDPAADAVGVKNEAQASVGIVPGEESECDERQTNPHGHIAFNLEDAEDHGLLAGKRVDTLLRDED